MDREAIARGQRRRAAEEALEVERDRMEMLEGEIEDLIAQLHGAAIDEAAFATMQPDDVETVRALLLPQPDFEVDEEWAENEDDMTDEDAESGSDEDPTAELEEEISRLESEIEIAKQRRQALERYLAALGD
jgi:Tfp pilus assembly protein FimV